MSKEIVAYKVFNSAWKCRDFQYELGKRYKHEGEISICNEGFHACIKLADCFNYYAFDPDNKVAKVLLKGDIIHGDDKSVCNEIEILEELSWYSVLDLVNSGYRNSGYCNSGDNNSGNYNSGFFNTDTPFIRMFNKDTELKRNDIDIPYIRLPITKWISVSELTDVEKEDNPNYETTTGYLRTLSYKESWKEAWKDVTTEVKEKFINLPNFDKEVFKEITGIEV